jgi:hypothetical protein
MIVEYPKALYLRGWDDLDAMVTVYDAGQEAEARADGYRALVDPPVVPAVVDDAPEEPKRRGRPPKAVSE